MYVYLLKHGVVSNDTPIVNVKEYYYGSTQVFSSFKKAKDEALRRIFSDDGDFLKITDYGSADNWFDYVGTGWGKEGERGRFQMRIVITRRVVL